MVPKVAGKGSSIRGQELELVRAQSRRDRAARADGDVAERGRGVAPSVCRVKCQPTRSDLLEGRLPVDSRIGGDGGARRKVRREGHAAVGGGRHRKRHLIAHSNEEMCGSDESDGDRRVVTDLSAEERRGAVTPLLEGGAKCSYLAALRDLDLFDFELAVDRRAVAAVGRDMQAGARCRRSAARVQVGSYLETRAGLGLEFEGPGLRRRADAGGAWNGARGQLDVRRRRIGLERQAHAAGLRSECAERAVDGHATDRLAPGDRIARFSAHHKRHVARVSLSQDTDQDCRDHAAVAVTHPDVNDMIPEIQPRGPQVDPPGAGPRPRVNGRHGDERRAIVQREGSATDLKVPAGTVTSRLSAVWGG